MSWVDTGVDSREQGGNARAGNWSSARRERDRLAQTAGGRGRLSFLAAGVALIGASLACQLTAGGAEESTAPAPAATSTPAAETVEAKVSGIVDRIDPAQPESLDAAEELVALGRPAAPALLDLLDSPELVARWAAVYALSRLAQPEDIPELAQGLDDPNLSNRAGIAATLLWLGDERGLPVLLEALKSDEQMAFSHPPERVADYARHVLEELSPQSLPEGSLDRRGPGLLAAPVPSPARDVTVAASDCTIDIVLNLQFSGAGASEALATKWERGIRDMWDGKQSSYCCKVNLTINTRVGGAEDSDYTQVTVVQVPPGGYYRSNVTMGTVTGGASNNVEASWASNDGGVVAAHEAGHAMGVDDEYRDGPDGGSVPTGEAVHDGDGEGRPSAMAQTWEDDEGDAPEAKRRHIDAILKYYGVRCICCGSVEWSVTGAGFAFEGQVFTCDGVSWQGEYSHTLHIGPTAAQVAADFELDLPEGADSAEVQFVSEGTWTLDDEVVPFQDNIVFKMALAEDGTRATIDMESQGGVLYVEGRSVPVPQAQPGTTGGLEFPVEPYQACAGQE